MTDLFREVHSHPGVDSHVRASRRVSFEDLSPTPDTERSRFGASPFHEVKSLNVFPEGRDESTPFQLLPKKNKKFFCGRTVKVKGIVK